MSRTSFEVADILRRHLADYLDAHHLSFQQYKAAQAIMHCRTAALGGHVDACTACGHWVVSYNSCGNRHCPKCQWSAQQRWIKNRTEELLPVTYFHLVFTLPDGLNPVVMNNEAKLYDLLFRAAWETLGQLARQPQWLGAQAGMIAVLHTWGQNLSLHPHLHCIVPGGGLANDKTTWVRSRHNCFLPVRVLSRLFRGKFLHYLRDLYQQGQLEFCGQAAALEHEKTFKQLLTALYKKEWVVYAKRPFGGPEQVINYLGRYTHRIAISNRRILAVQNGNVSFTYKDYRNNGQQKSLTLDATEFIRRFLQHCLPPGFHKIRYYGILSIRNRKTKLATLQKSLQYQPTAEDPDAKTQPLKTCPACGRPSLQHLGIIPARLFNPGRTSAMYIPCSRAPPAASPPISLAR